MIGCTPKPEQKPISLQLTLKPKAFQKITQKREEALSRRYLDSKKSDYVKGVLKVNGQLVKVNARLKGDHVDHLQGERWSFRIKADSLVLGNKKFSVHNVATRRYQLEWAFHTLLKEVGVIGLDYHFVEFSVNDSLKGIYGYESHFKNELLRNNGRELGPIIGLDETNFWTKGIYGHLKGEEQDDSLMMTAPIKVYNKKWAKKNNEITELAKKKLQLYQFCAVFPDGVMDLKKWADYIAVSELMGFNHNLRWHNLKFYFNPNTQLIEPIGYDAEANFDYGFLVFLSEKRETFYDMFYKSPAFKKELIKSLERVGQEAFLDSVFDKHSETIDFYEELNQREHPEYYFQRDAFYYSQEKLLEGAELLRKEMNLSN